MNPILAVERLVQMKAIFNLRGFVERTAHIPRSLHSGTQFSPQSIHCYAAMNLDLCECKKSRLNLGGADVDVLSREHGAGLQYNVPLTAYDAMIGGEPYEQPHPVDPFDSRCYSNGTVGIRRLPVMSARVIQSEWLYYGTSWGAAGLRKNRVD
jgi:hypothetical protein